jgi:hypothetical protein
MNLSSGGEISEKPIHSLNPTSNNSHKILNAISSSDVRKDNNFTASRQTKSQANLNNNTHLHSIVNPISVTNKDVN